MQVQRQFLTTTADGLLVQSHDLGDKTDPAMTVTLGFDRRIPTPLLLVQTTGQHVDLMVQFSVRMVLPTLTSGALTLMNCC